MTQSIYTQFFNFDALPFSINPDPRFMYSSALHQEGLAHLSYGIKGNGGFVALTGEVGTGKTMLCHCLLQHLPKNVDLALILNPRLDALELLASICDELGIYYSPTETTLKYLNDVLNRYLLIAHSRGRNTVLMIDEAQNLTLEVLEQIRLLTNLETPTEKLLQIILVGQPELQDLLDRPDLRQLNQRITARYHLRALGEDDTRKYIQHRLLLCKGQLTTFSLPAIKQIYKYSGGVPRVINMLCDRSLLGAYTLSKQQVDVGIVDQAAHELQLSKSTLAENKWSWPLLWLLLAGSILLVSNAGVRHFITTWHGKISQTLHDTINQVRGNTTPAGEKNTAISAETAIPSVHQDASPTITQIQTPTTDLPRDTHDTKAMGENAIAQLQRQKSLTLMTALKHGTQALDKFLPVSSLASCEGVERFGVHCLRESSSWSKVFLYQRPVILEFDVTSGRKVYALFKALKDDMVFLQGETEFVLNLGDLLSAWNGNYIILWESPFSGSKEITPQETSHAVSWLRQLINMPASDGRDRYFDDALRDKVKAFQRQHDLLADGVAGGRTLILLQNEQRTTANQPVSQSNK